MKLTSASKRIEITERSGIKMISLQHVSKSFGKQKILQDINLEVEKGEIIGLLGPNGAGKTTLIRLMNGVIKPDSGKIFIDGLDLMDNSEDIRKRVGIVTESAGLYHEMSGYENLEFFADIYGVCDKKRIEELLFLFGLQEHQKQQTGTYSTGMKKRLALAKALLHKPDLLFLDEPTNGLDPDGIKMALSYLGEYQKQTGTTIFICSHVLHQLESICTSFAFLEKGRIIEKGTIEQLTEKYTKEAKVEIKTNLEVKSGSFAGFPCEQQSENCIIFTLPSKKYISGLLQEVLKNHWVETVALLNTDLESIYFQVRSCFDES